MIQGMHKTSPLVIAFGIHHSQARNLYLIIITTLYIHIHAGVVSEVAVAVGVPIAVILSSVILAILIFAMVAAFFVHKRKKKGEL